MTTTDGTGASWYQRDPQAFRRLLARSVQVHERFVREWPQLAQRYRDALPELTSPKAWEETFDAVRPSFAPSVRDVAVPAAEPDS